MDIVDSHIHYWEPDRPERPWDKEGVDIGEPLVAERLLADAEEAGVAKVVQVTPTLMGYDNRYGIEAAQKYPDRILGVFGRFDPTGADMPARLDALRRTPAILGVRLTFLKPPFTDWFTDGTLGRFAAEAGGQGVPLAFYAPRRPREAAAVARQNPKARILVDHMTLRHQDCEPFSFWDDVLALAEIPNIWIKVSYFPEVAHTPYPFADVQGRFRQIVERFGADRLIWGSNYPPSAAACTYKQNVDFSLAACDFLSEADKAKLFGGTFLRAIGRASAS
jgi:predicted TIM-barrel fold metal-dependent hydrolase